MRVMKLAILAFALGCIVEIVPVWGIVEITPSNVVLPTSAGELFSFDLIISSSGSTDVNASGFQCTIGVSPEGLTFEDINSEAVIADPGYWIYDNSFDVYAQSLGGDNYRFGDSPDFPLTEILFGGDIMARYAFTWDGNVGDYTFTLDLDTSNSYVLLDDFFSKEALQLNPGSYPGDISSFTVTVPEPTTLMLFALSSTILLKKRKT